MERVMTWVKAHPWEAGLISLGLLLVLLWLFGFFGSGSSSASSSGGQNLAAAYYAAEAAQTTAATQLQMATVAYGNQTAQTQIQATAAQGIASTQAGMYTTLGQQGSDTQIALSHDNLLSTTNSNDDALAATNTATMYSAQTAQAGFQASAMHDYLTTTLPTELALTGGAPVASTFGNQGVNFGVGPPSIAGLVGQGYSPAQATQIAQSAGWQIA
jgi:hypothetical protein